MSLADVADLTGFQRSHISQLETSKNFPSLQALYRLGVAFNISAIDLLRGIYPWDGSAAPGAEQTGS